MNFKAYAMTLNDVTKEWRGVKGLAAAFFEENEVKKTFVTTVLKGDKCEAKSLALD